MAHERRPAPAHSYGTCPGLGCGKQMYASRKVAKQTAKVAFPWERNLVAYRCEAPGGDGYHLGHRDDYLRAKRGRDIERDAS